MPNLEDQLSPISSYATAFNLLDDSSTPVPSSAPSDSPSPLSNPISPDFILTDDDADELIIYLPGDEDLFPSQTTFDASAHLIDLESGESCQSLLIEFDPLANEGYLNDALGDDPYLKNAALTTLNNYSPKSLENWFRSMYAAGETQYLRLSCELVYHRLSLQNNPIWLQEDEELMLEEGDPTSLANLLVQYEADDIAAWLSAMIESPENLYFRSRFVVIGLRLQLHLLQSENNLLGEKIEQLEADIAELRSPSPLFASPDTYVPENLSEFLDQVYGTTSPSI